MLRNTRRTFLGVLAALPVVGNLSWLATKQRLAPVLLHRNDGTWTRGQVSPSIPRAIRWSDGGFQLATKFSGPGYVALYEQA